MLNLVQLGGTVLKDPDLRDARGGTFCAEFTVAIKSVRFDRAVGADVMDQVFVRCIAWEDVAEQVTALVHQGSVVLVTGQLTQQEITGKDGRKERKTKVQALSVQVVRTPPSSKSSPSGDDQFPG